MRAMVLEGPGPKRLTSADREIPIALPGEIRVRVRACGVCRTDLHLVDGDLRDGEFPIIPGHEIVGVVDQLGDGVTEFAVGDRVGIDRKSTRLNSSHSQISYAVFCLKT